MQKAFKEYYNLSEKEFSSLWKSAIFVFDTNTLLNFYRYSDATVVAFLQILEKLKDRIWIPFQIGKEFHEDRLSVINQQSKIYYESSTKITDIYNTFLSDSKNPFLDKDILDEFSKILEKVTKYLEGKKNSFTNKILEDDILLKITSLFENKVGENYTEEKLKELFSQGNKRYIDKIPPGYQDKSKPEPNKYGDYIIWNQIIDHAKNKKQPVIFISDDRKEDWWLIDSGKLIGPRPELRKEFYSSSNELFYMYQPFKFLEYAYKFLEIKIIQDTIDEVKDLKPFSEESLTSNFKNDILISVLLEKKDGNNIDGFIELLKTSGYEVYHEDIENKRSKLYIPIPNIPDLKRRINSRFISQIEDYGLTLIEFRPTENG